MVRMAARVLLLVLLASWSAPAALAPYVSPQHACCRRGAHHCPQSTDSAFRDARLHCRSCQTLVTAHQAPRVSPAAVGVAATDEHPFAHEVASAFSPDRATRSHAQRAPPLER